MWLVDTEKHWKKRTHQFYWIVIERSLSTVLEEAAKKTKIFKKRMNWKYWEKKLLVWRSFY